MPRVSEKVPSFTIKYGNGQVVQLYPLVIDKMFQFDIRYLTNVDFITINMDKSFYKAKVQAKKIMGVVEGKEGYLFLDNDNNQSVAQFTGIRCIDKEGLEQWKLYLKKICAFS